MHEVPPLIYDDEHYQENLSDETHYSVLVNQAPFYLANFRAPCKGV